VATPTDRGSSVWESWPGVPLQTVRSVGMGEKRRGWSSTAAAPASKRNRSEQIAMKSDSRFDSPKSKMMRSIATSQTDPELRVANVLDGMSMVYSTNVATLPGKPDLVLPNHQTVIFVHGCFWHRHPRCKKGVTLPKINENFWKEKLRKNCSRDRAQQRELRSLGWSVITLWECDCRRPAVIKTKISTALNRKRMGAKNDD
jgi:DNA mismatch endonuclease (patch repair protein)